MSYLLIGFYFKRWDSRSFANMKAFWSTVSAISVYLGIAAIAMYFGSLTP